MSYYCTVLLPLVVRPGIYHITKYQENDKGNNSRDIYQFRITFALGERGDAKVADSFDGINQSGVS